MGSLNAFLHPVQTENRDVIVSKRFVENDEVVPFTIRPITQEENESLMRKYTKKDKKSGADTFNRIGYNHELTALAVVSPNLESAELQAAYGTLGAVKTLEKMLYMGEFSVLFEAVQEISGLDKDINDDKEEAKN
jgi:hypothetical protein